MRKLAVILACLCLSGCASMLPQWRLFQKKVPAPIVKPAAQIETERRTADYIARKIEWKSPVKTMALNLSASIGRPERPIADDDEAVIEQRMRVEWDKVLLKEQDQRAELNERLTAQEGKKIEGTGYNIFGFSVGFAGLALIVLCVMFPPLATILWAVFKRVSGALTSTATGISNFIKDNPDAGEKLKGYLAKTQDAAHKQIISKIKAKL